MGELMKRFLPFLVLAGGITFSESEAEASKWVFNYNHPDLEWYTLETEHFQFHYPVSKEKEGNPHYLTAEYSARRFATVAEENWHDMCAEFNYFLKEKTHVMVLNQGDTLEGFTIPSWDWIVMSANPGGGSFSYSRGRMEWFSTVFAHEFAHVVSLKAYAAHAEGAPFGDYIGGLYENGINYGQEGFGLNHMAIGVTVPISDSDSVWWTEGGAEFWSGATNINWWTSARDRTIRTSTLEDRLLTYEEWHTRAGKGQSGWNEGERYYQGGHSFALYIRERFGEKHFAQFALEYSKRWRPNFESVVEDVLGVDDETLYYDWKAHITERYNLQVSKVKAKGEVVGKEVLNSAPDWEYTTPEGRDEWLGTKKGIFGKDKRGWFGRKSQREREAAKEGTGRWQFEPRVSPDGKYLGALKRGVISVSRADRQDVRAFTNESTKDSTRRGLLSSSSFYMPFAKFDHGWDFVPGEDTIMVTGSEDDHPFGAFTTVTGIRFEADGYDWNQIYEYKFPDFIEQKSGNVKWLTRSPSKGFLKKKMWHGEWKPIPNTKRGHDPAVSPDGKKIAFLQYTDGTENLAIINRDGSEKKLLTNYSDGNWMRIVDWSPDGKQLVLMIFRNFQQNLYTINADGTDLKPIMMDEWEEQDPHWAHDGKIYFSADPDGISNIFSYDPQTKKFLQITNVINGAYAPQITKDGDLLYLYYTGHGWKIYGLSRTQFLNDEASHFYTTDVSDEHVKGYLTQTLDDSRYEKMTSKYRPMKTISSPIWIPIVQVQNNSRTAWDLQGGAQLLLMDYAQFNQMMGFFQLGARTQAQLSYTNDMWYPSVSMFGGIFQGKSEQAYLLDADDDPLTTSDQTIFDVRRNVRQNFGGLFVSYPWNGRFSTGINVFGWNYFLKNIDDVAWEEFMWNVEVTLNAYYSNNAYFARSANPYFGRTIDANISHGWSDFVYPPMGGVIQDDGENLDDLQFNRLELRWTEMIPVPSFWTEFFKQARKRKHTIQLDTHLGWVDRNVSGNQEFNAGGRHPSNAGGGSLQSNTQFAGYPAWGLGGETMMVFNMAYRFPLTRPEQNWLWGPFYLYGLYAQVGGTAGNLWSFRPPDDPKKFYRSRYGERIAYDPADVVREIPFQDTAYKNGNSMLYDLSFELRMTSMLYHTASWNSFLRVAYALNEIRGYGDVNGDDVFDTNDSALGDELSNEYEPPGFRFYLGLGTGW
jgi:hypothetical protein